MKKIAQPMKHWQRLSKAVAMIHLKEYNFKIQYYLNTLIKAS